MVLSTDKDIIVIYEVNNSETSAKRIFASVNSKTKITQTATATKAVLFNNPPKGGCSPFC